MQTLLEGIGWPRAAPNSQHGTGSAAGYVLKGGGQRSVEAELRVQLMTLQVVGPQSSPWCLPLPCTGLVHQWPSSANMTNSICFIWKETNGMQLGPLSVYGKVMPTDIAESCSRAVLLQPHTLQCCYNNSKIF